MPKKDELQTAPKAEIKKSKSAEELKPASEKQELAFPRAENQDLRIQISELDKLFQTKQKEHEKQFSQLAQENNALTDQNNELRLQHLKDSDALKASQKNEDEFFAKYQAESKQNNQLKLHLAQIQSQFTRTQQDLKQSQRIIELKLPSQKQTNPQPNY